MATTTGSGGSYPTLLELPLVSKYPKPDPIWTDPVIGGCPHCEQKVWFHELIRTAMREPKNIAICSVCMVNEKDRQSKS